MTGQVAAGCQDTAGEAGNRPVCIRDADPDASGTRQVAARCRCNRFRCPLARMSGLQCFNIGHNGHGINMYGVSMTLMAN